MTDPLPQQQPRPGAPEPEPHVNPVTVGGVVFAVCVLVIVGAYHTIAGLSAILGENYYQQQNDYAFDFDVNARGWVELITGFIVLLAALNLFAGRVWARTIGILVAMFSAMQNFFFTPYQPVWSAIIIALDVLVIWSLAMYGHRVAHKVYGA
ncbi:hypothetical protein [Streptomyces sp. NPDC046939]|uniref:DUF7144 family membrane protein n=1 Tax=Streptomyces sp. NPDC046939 TaxID=3155376 RepID=UPI0033EF2608